MSTVIILVFVAEVVHNDYELRVTFVTEVSILIKINVYCWFALTDTLTCSETIHTVDTCPR